MNRKQMFDLLKEAGFTLKRRGSRHEIWTNGVEDIAISPKPTGSRNTQASFMSKMRKYKKALDQKKT